MNELRVMTYNVKSLRLSPAGVARVIRDSRADIVCIQEAPRFWRWQSKIRALAERSEMYVVTGGRPAGSMLLLARWGIRIVEHREVLLPRTLHRHQRGLAMGVFQAGARRVAVGSFHLGLTAEERLLHAPLIREAVAAFGRPVILGGDVNEDPDDPAWAVLSDGLQDAWEVAGKGEGYTSDPVDPRRRIDAIFVDHRLPVLSAELPDHQDVLTASDHRPVIAAVGLSTVAATPQMAP